MHFCVFFVYLLLPGINPVFKLVALPLGHAEKQMLDNEYLLIILSVCEQMEFV
jgi:hypothetical protein